MYWYLNKESNTPLIFTSLTAVSNTLGIPYERLKYHFSRIKAGRYEDSTHRIEKVKQISSKQQND